MVNLNASFKNTFFFLAYDKSVITKALNAEFNVNGDHFLEKIIQVDYSIPKISPELLESIFFKSFNEFALLYGQGSFYAEIRRIWTNGLKDYFTNLRHIYRYFNSLDVRYPAIKQDVK